MCLYPVAAQQFWSWCCWVPGSCHSSMPSFPHACSAAPSKILSLLSPEKYQQSQRSLQAEELWWAKVLLAGVFCAGAQQSPWEGFLLMGAQQQSWLSKSGLMPLGASGR